MKLEAERGPQGIWTNTDRKKDSNHLSDNSSDEEEEQDEEDDINEKINDDVTRSSDDSDDNEEADLLPQHDLDPNQKKESTTKSGGGGGDFIRNPGVIGIILQDDLEEESELYHRKKETKEEEEDVVADESGSDHKNRKNQSAGFDPLALRKYELSKLKYYFAIVDCSSIKAAETLYTQLDGAEFGHSSMVFEMRYVQEDVDFTNRNIHDICLELPVDYKPPDFVVNALQVRS